MKEKIFDYIIITVSNKKQKECIHEKIIDRIKKNLIPAETAYRIIIEKEKIGSGGAIFNLIRYFETMDKNIFKEKKVLLINSAGDSKRMILYADSGKICTPTFEKKYNTIHTIIFDEIITGTELIGREMLPGLLVVSGDCITRFNNFPCSQIKNNTAISVKANIEVGENHGVFVEENGLLFEALQKNTEQELRNKKAVDENENVNLDTGIIYLNADTMEKLRKIITTEDILDEEKFLKMANSQVRSNFYTDFIYPLSQKSTFDAYLKQKAEREMNPNIIHARKQIWNALKGEYLEIQTVNDGKFIHYGTIKEFLDRAFEIMKKDNIILNSKISSDSKISKKCYIENSVIEKSNISENSIILNSEIFNQNIPKDLILKTIKLEDHQYITIILGIGDNLKEEDYHKIKLFNKNIGMLLKENDFINEENKTLWDCKLYLIQRTKREAITTALELFHNFDRNKYEINKQDRLSIQEILEKLSNIK